MRTIQYSSRTSGLAVALVLISGCSQEVPKPPADVPKVTVRSPEVRRITDYDDYSGWMDASQTVEVRARVRGHIDKVHFVDGQMVTKGTLLFELDPRPFQSEIDRAKEQVKVYQAQQYAAANEQARYKDLIGRGAATKSQLERSAAEVQSFDAQIGSAKQEIKRRELELEYAQIKAEISGRIGRAMLTEGNLVNAGGSDPLLTTIVAVNPINVYFNIDERSLQRYQKRYSAQSGGANTVKALKIPFKFARETDEGYPFAGVLDFAENRVDPTTGTIQVRGAAVNDRGLFVPGSRVRVRIPVSEPYEPLLVPDLAIQADQDKRYLLVLGADKVVKRRNVTLGRLLDDGMRIVKKSENDDELKPNDRVIVEGLQMARINYPVEPIESTPAAVIKDQK